MNGILYITGALADGGVTTAKIADDAVTDAKLANSINSAIAANTAKTTNATHTGDVTGSTSLTIANDAVTTAKIADNNVTEAKLALNAVTNNRVANGSITNAKIGNGAIDTAKLADQAVTLAKLEHGTSSNDGKFLRANNGADPTFETVSIPAGTTINNNADNRVITGSGTANTLNGESTLTYSNPTLGINTDTSPYGSLNLNGNSGGLIQFIDNEVVKWSLFGDSTFSIYDNVNSANRIRIDSSGNVGIGTSSPVGKLNIQAPSVSGGLSDALTLSTVTYSTNGGQRIVFKSDDATYNTWRYAEIGAIYSGGSYGGALVFRTNNGSSATGLSEEMRIQAGGGISFNGDTASANALDDYEEGTWTPVCANGGLISVSPSSNRYTKIGRMVFACGRIAFGSSGSGATAKITLPFTPDSNVTASAVGSACFEQSYDSNNTVMACINDTGGVIFRKNGSGNLKNDQVAGTVLRFCVYYMAT